MRTLALAALCVALTGCASIPGMGAKTGQDNESILSVIREIAKDPSCGHIDRIQGNLGGLTGNNLSVFLERTCPPPQPGAASE